MQLTPEILLQFAETTVDKLTRIDTSIQAAYLAGSVVMPQNPLLGGTTDIDLVFIHGWTPTTDREILRLTDDVHLDILHHSQADYQQGRELRVDPWMGPMLNNAKPLYDPRHFIDFTQATVRGQFNRPDHIVRRARSQSGKSRQAWFELNQLSAADAPEQVLAYLQAVACAANAVALLVGKPLTGRRLTLEFPARAAAVGRVGMHAGLQGLLGAPRLDRQVLEAWLARWNASMAAISGSATPIEIHPYRRNYYLKAFEAMLDAGAAEALLWPLLYTWSLAAGVLPVSAPGRQDWQVAVHQLGLWGSAFAERVAALDAFLDQVEEVVDGWEQSNGG